MPPGQRPTSPYGHGTGNGGDTYTEFKARRAAKTPRVGPMMGTSGDSGGFNPPKGAYDYTGASKGGLWKNRGGTVVGRSAEEDSTITPYKSTGDSTLARYIKQRKAAGTKGY